MYTFGDSVAPAGATFESAETCPGPDVAAKAIPLEDAAFLGQSYPPTIPDNIRALLIEAESLDSDDSAPDEVIGDRLSAAIRDLTEEVRSAIVESLAGTHSFWLKVLCNLICEADRGKARLGKG